MPKTIRQTASFKAGPRAVYEALMDSRKHAAFSGMPARIDKRVGGRFTAYGGYLEGVTIELVPNRRIVQFWRSKNWPAHYYSTVTFDLAPERGGTRLRFTQEGVPVKDYAAKRSGWTSQYWEKMKRFLER
jgi:activator of HSP90 ATPase